jgi:hypothetical protein
MNPSFIENGLYKTGFRKTPGEPLLSSVVQSDANSVPGDSLRSLGVYNGVRQTGCFAGQGTK